MPPDDAVDPPLNWVTHALMFDETLGGLCSKIDEMGTSWAPAEHDVTVMTAQVVFEVSYQTRRNDPEMQT